MLPRGDMLRRTVLSNSSAGNWCLARRMKNVALWLTFFALLAFWVMLPMRILSQQAEVGVNVDDMAVCDSPEAIHKIIDKYSEDIVRLTGEDNSNEKSPQISEPDKVLGVWFETATEIVLEWDYDSLQGINTKVEFMELVSQRMTKFVQNAGLQKIESIVDSTVGKDTPIIERLHQIVSDHGDTFPQIATSVKQTPVLDCRCSTLTQIFEIILGGWPASDLDVSKISGAEAIIAFAFGQGDLTNGYENSQIDHILIPNPPLPGGSNMGLAITVLKLLKANPNLKVFAQWEIGNILTGYSYYPEQQENIVEVPPLTFEGISLASLWPDTSDISSRLYTVYPRPGEYLSTIGVYERAVEFDQFQENPPKKVIVVGHIDHRKRCWDVVARSAWRTGSAVLDEENVLISGDQYYPSSLEWRQIGCDANGYDPKSTQNWTVSRNTFLMEEIPWRIETERLGHYKEIEQCN